jgi:hypothetical protein
MIELVLAYFVSNRVVSKSSPILHRNLDLAKRVSSNRFTFNDLETGPRSIGALRPGPLGSHFWLNQAPGCASPVLP